jgi:1,4-dihydroxy-2-naphthoate polyprenyltransferase
MSGLPRLYVRMLRYRVAAMVWMFMLLGAAYPAGLPAFSLDYVWATIALASSYVAATSVNDIADREIDRINHPCDAGRPLVTGEACERDLWLLDGVATGAALVSAALLGIAALAIVCLSLVIGIVYSLRPVRLSYRTWLAPLALATAYVAIPYSLGLLVAERSPGAGDLVLGSGLYTLFVARIVLKDFRDRPGDAAYGKPTLLLRFGKPVTCAASLAALLLGAALLLATTRDALALQALVVLFVVAVAAMLDRLRRSPEGHAEQVAIGIGAKLGNGLLVSLLTWFVLIGERAPPDQRLAVLAALAALFGASFAALVARPDAAVIGYKG